MTKIKREVKPYRRKLNQEQDIIDVIQNITPQERFEKTIKRDLAVREDQTYKIKTFEPITDDIFDAEVEKFKAEKASLRALNTDLESSKPNPKYVMMVTAPMFKKPKVVVNLNIEKMTPQELIDFMKEASKKKGEV